MNHPQIGPKQPTQERLRLVATELFAARGYGGASISDIATGVGVRKASLYNYYPSKEELFLDLVRGSLDAWADRSRPALEEPGSYEQRLRGHLQAAVDFVGERPHEVAVLRLACTQIGGELGGRVLELIHDHERSYFARMKRFFVNAAAAGEIQGAEADDLVLMWRVFLDGLLMNHIDSTPLSERFAGRLEGLWRLFWRGLSGQGLSRKEAGS